MIKNEYDRVMASRAKARAIEVYADEMCGYTLNLFIEAAVSRVAKSTRLALQEEAADMAAMFVDSLESRVDSRVAKEAK